MPTHGLHNLMVSLLSGVIAFEVVVLAFTLSGGAVRPHLQVGALIALATSYVVYVLRAAAQSRVGPYGQRGMPVPGGFQNRSVYGQRGMSVPGGFQTGGFQNRPSRSPARASSSSSWQRL